MPTEFSAEAVLDVLEESYSFYADTLNYRTTDVNNIQYKFIVIIDESWSVVPSPNTATPNSVRNFDDLVDGMWLDIVTATNVNEILKAHEVAHLFQRIEPLEYPPPEEQLAYQSMEESHAQYLAYSTYTNFNPDYIGRQARNRESWLRKNVYFRFYLLLYLQEKIGSMGVNGLYNNLYFKEHPFKGYGRIFNKSVAYMNGAFTEFAMRTVNLDFEDRQDWTPPLNIYERDGILETNMDNDGWFTVEAENSMFSTAPEAYGFNVHEIQTYNSSQISLTFESIKQNDPIAGNNFGFVAVKNGQVRYSPIYNELSTDVTFSVNSNERVFLVVTGSPKEYVYIDENDIYNAIYDYPYRYKVDLAVNCLNFLADCDDGNMCTINDIFDANCNCNGVEDASASFQIPFVAVNIDNSGWETDTQTFYAQEGDDIGFSWAGTTNNETWYHPDGTVLSNNLIFYLYNVSYEDSGTYVLEVFDNNNCTSEIVELDIIIECPNVGIECDDGNLNTLNDIFNEECVCEGTPSGLILNIKVFFEGFLNPDGNMTNSLNASGLIPQFQPFNNDPWFYNGSENFQQLPYDAVDWVLINIYDQNENILETQAGVVFRDGQVFNTIDGLNYLQFSSTASEAKFISIHHKSHLALVADLSSLSDNIIDFTSGIALGINQTKTKYNQETMISGDFDGNGLINNLDYNIWGENSSAVNGYFLQDGDGNALINNADFNLWAVNKSKVGQPLIQF